MPNVMVHVVDDDESMRHALQRLLQLEKFDTATYTSAEDFLERARTRPGHCLITDLRMPDMTGIDLLSRVISQGLGLKVILLTAYATVPLAVQATKIGAANVLEKPFQAQALIDAITSCERAPSSSEKSSAVTRRFAELSPREREVLDRLVLGLQNKLIGYELGISHRTVEIHRANIMKKTGVGSLSELIRGYLTAAAATAAAA
jgi:two-component system, LuxR family, response regulator FixJ